MTIEPVVNRTKVAIVGMGYVGSTFAYALVISGLAEDIVVVDVDRDKALGEAMDLSHASPFVPPVQVKVGTYEDCADAAIVVICAGAAQKPGETRLDLLRRNAGVFRDIVGDLNRVKARGILLVVTNPVDVLTYVTMRLAAVPSSRVIGSGTVLDSARFRSLLSAHCAVDARNVHAYVVGEHGDSEVPIWSMVNIAGTPIAKVCEQCDKQCDDSAREGIFKNVREAAYQIIERKGVTNYAIGLALLRICGSILRDEHSVLTVSTYLDDYLGISDVCLSVPCLVGARGVRRQIVIPLDDDELKKLRHSADVLKESIARLGLPAPAPM